MLEISQTTKGRHKERGSIAIMAAFTLTIVVLIMGLVYDFGLWFVTRAELQNVADTAAMAGGRALGAIYAGGSVDNGTQIVNPPRQIFTAQQTYTLNTQDNNLIRNAITNPPIPYAAGGTNITIANNNDITVGNWNTTTNTFTPLAVGSPSPPQPNAIQVIARRDQSNVPLAAMFGSLANITGYNITATATAALTPLQFVPPQNPPAALPPGQLVWPLGIDQANPNLACGALPIVVDITQPPSCTAWTTYNNAANQANFNQIVAGTLQTPATLAGNGGTAFFFGGLAEAQAPGLFPLWQANNLGNPIFFETVLPVYQNSSCIPPAGQQIPIVGFVNARVIGAPGGNPTTNAFLITVQCNVFSTGRSGDVNDPNLLYGTLGSVPVLVQ